MFGNYVFTIILPTDLLVYGLGGLSLVIPLSVSKLNLALVWVCC